MNEPLHATLTPEERRQAAASGDLESAGYPAAAQAKPEAIARTKCRSLLADPEKVDEIMERVAAGWKLTDLAGAYGIKYVVFHQMLKTRYGERLQAARAAHADEIAGTNLALADDIEKGRIDAQSGKAAAGIRQWYIERVAPDDWGQKSSVDVNHRGVIGLHLDALRQLNNEPLEGETAANDDAEDADFEEVSEASSVPSNIDDHPLL